MLPLRMVVVLGEFGEGYVRVGLLMDEERLEEAVTRVSKLHLFDKVTQQ